MDPNKYKQSGSASGSGQQQPSTSGASSSSSSKYEPWTDKSLSKDKKQELFFKDQSGLKSFKQSMYDRPAFDNKWKESKDFLGDRGMAKFLKEKDKDGWKARDGLVFWGTYDHLKSTQGTFTKEDHKKAMTKAYTEEMPMKYSQLKMEGLSKKQDQYKKEDSYKKK